MVGEVDADDADAPRPHVCGEAERDVGRVLRVVERVAVREVRPAVGAEAEPDHAAAREPEVELREDVLGARAFDEAEAVARELVARVDDDEVARREAPPDVVDADGHEPLGRGQPVQRLAAAADDDARAAVYVTKVGEVDHVARRRPAQAGDFSRPPSSLPGDA
jgi:hypothetical protein